MQRTLTLSALLAALLVSLSNSHIPPLGVATFQDLARLGEAFYIAVIGTQLTLVLPPRPAELSDADLDGVAAGYCIATMFTN